MKKRFAFADGGKAEKTGFAVLAQPLEGRHDIDENLLNAECFSASSLSDRIVKMEDVDVIAAQPRHALVERFRHRSGNAAETDARQPNFGADERIRRLQFLQDAAKILLRFTIAVLHRGVEVVHAGVDGSRDSPLLVEWIAANHQSADRATAEAKHREPNSGAAEHSHFHHRSSVRKSQMSDAATKLP
ncbi:MAG: hypothetical protein WB689_18155 [Xanthobacteraceae bacterium]